MKELWRSHHIFLWILGVWDSSRVVGKRGGGNGVAYGVSHHKFQGFDLWKMRGGEGSGV